MSKDSETDENMEFKITEGGRQGIAEFCKRGDKIGFPICVGGKIVYIGKGAVRK